MGSLHCRRELKHQGRVRRPTTSCSELTFPPPARSLQKGHSRVPLLGELRSVTDRAVGRVTHVRPPRAPVRGTSRSIAPRSEPCTVSRGLAAVQLLNTNFAPR